jgi:hypothetical protein
VRIAASGGGQEPARITDVVGGAFGIEATYDAVRALAGAYDTAGSELRCWAALGVRTMTNPDLIESALLCPVTFAEAEHAVVAATTGPDGVLVESVGWETDAILVRIALAALEETDRLVHASIEALDRLAGRAVGFALGATAPALLPTIALTSDLLPAPVRRDVEGELEDWVVDHPGVVQHAVNGGGGLLEGLWDGLTPPTPGGPLGIPLLTPDTESAAGLLATLYGEDGGAQVLRTACSVPGGTTQPTSLTDLVSHLRDVAHLSPAPDSPLNGTIEIQTIGAGQDVRHIVYLPGTDDLTTLPWTQDGDVRDMATNLRLVGGMDNAYQQGILDAMAQARIGRHEPVLLVGHSQGGMEAAAILSRGSDYHVTDVVTAGSPTAQVDGFPVGSHVLSLEHQGDVVPLLDGEDNPGSVEQVTVTFDDDGTGIVDNHEYAHYVAGAAEADRSTDPTVVEQLDSLRAHGFLAEAGARGPTTSSQVFQILRKP